MKNLIRHGIWAALGLTSGLTSLLSCGWVQPASAQEQTVPRIRVPRAGGAVMQVPSAGMTTLNPTVLGGARGRFSVNANLTLKSPSILKARGAQSAELLNKDVTVQGFYYEGSVPMIVDDIERTQVDMMMPPESYVPLVNRIATLQNGDEVAITGRLIVPAANNLSLFEEPSALQVAGNATITKITEANPRWRQLVANQRVFIPVKQLTDGIETKYAVLIVGGGNSSSNHLRYWNDLKVMYGILLGRNYKPANIKVIYASGVARDNSMPVHFSATKANISAVFKTLGDKLDAGDDLYVMLNDHGGGFLTQQVGNYGPGSYGAVLDPTNSVGAGISEAAYGFDLNLDGDTGDTVHFHSTLSLWGGSMTGDEFRDALNQVKLAKQTVVQMKQCFSGGFAQRLTRAKRVVMSSSGPNELSWSHSSGNYGAFTYAYFTALAGRKPDNATPINTNPNGDGMVSMTEAWNYARSNSTAAASETGLYADNIFNPKSGAMPSGVHGGFGATITP